MEAGTELARAGKEPAVEVTSECLAGKTGILATPREESRHSGNTRWPDYTGGRAEHGPLVKRVLVPQTHSREKKP